jgi:hypothetical protein
MDITYISSKYCVGLVSYTCGAKFSLVTSLWFGFIRILQDHHDKIAAFVIKEIEFAFVLHNDRI